MIRTCGTAGLLVVTFATCANAQTQTPVAGRLDAADVFRKTSAAVVTITTPSGFGSGLLVDPSGVIATNFHVVRGDTTATVTLANHDVYDDVEVVAVDVRKDLVLLKVKAFKAPSLTLGDSDDLSVGNTVYAIGAPKGLALTMSEGIVSGLRDSGEGYRVIQTNAAISPGSSGGGLFNGKGDLVGITTYKIEGGENLNFAVPVNYMRGMLATTAKFTLAELAGKYPNATDDEQRRGAGSASVSPGSTPRLALFYRSAGGGATIIVEQGENGAIASTRVNTTGEVVGHATLLWDPAKKAFIGTGTMVACGRYGVLASVSEEIYFVNDRFVRSRWTMPGSCRNDKVKSYTWMEVLYYVPER